MSSKEFDPNPTADALAGRFGNRAAKKTPPVAAVPDKPAPPKMTTRSWYMAQTTATALDQAAEKIRRTVPAVSKHQALDALLQHAIAHQADVATLLAEQRRTEDLSGPERP